MNVCIYTGEGTADNYSEATLRKKGQDGVRIRIDLDPSPFSMSRSLF